MPLPASAGSICLFSNSYCRMTRLRACSLTAANTSLAGRRSSPVISLPSLICSFNPAIRISKNSSRLEETMDKKRSRSSKGTRASSAWARTRRLKASRLNSRLRKRTPGDFGEAGGRAGIGLKFYRRIVAAILQTGYLQTGCQLKYYCHIRGVGFAPNQILNIKHQH